MNSETEFNYSIYIICKNLLDLAKQEEKNERKYQDIAESLANSSDVPLAFIKSQTLTYETFAGAWEKWQQRTAI